MLDVEKFKAALLARRAELESTAETATQAAQIVELDQTRVGRVSRMDALQLQAMSREAMRRRELELARVESALQRIESGDFGYCQDCGEEIAVGRLEIDPAGTLCIDCASKREKAP